MEILEKDLEELNENPTALIKCSDVLKYYPELYDEIKRIYNYKITIENKEDCFNRFKVMCRKSEFYKDLRSKGLSDETSYMIMEKNMDNQRQIILATLIEAKESCLKLLALISYINGFDKKDYDTNFDTLIKEYGINLLSINDNEYVVLAYDLDRLISTAKKRIQYFDSIKTDYLHHNNDWMVIKENEIDMKIAFEKIKNLLNSFPETYDKRKSKIIR